MSSPLDIAGRTHSGARLQLWLIAACRFGTTQRPGLEDLVMPSIEYHKDVIFGSVEGINLSAPWRLRRNPCGHALTPEQEADLASRFDLDPEAVRTLSKMLNHVLDPAGSPNSFRVDRLQAEQRAEAKLRKALAEVTRSKERLTGQLRELESLTVAGWVADEAKAFFRQARAGLEELLAPLQQVQDDLERTLETPGTVRLDAPPDKRRVFDGRRRNVLLFALTTWDEAGRPTTYTTDPLTSKRGGLMIDFVNAVVRCVTEPATELSGETIIKEMKVLREFGRRDAERLRRFKEKQAKVS